LGDNIEALYLEWRASFRDLNPKAHPMKLDFVAHPYFPISKFANFSSALTIAE
jgi:hypothetical protein